MSMKEENHWHSHHNINLFPRRVHLYLKHLAVVVGKSPIRFCFPWFNPLVVDSVELAGMAIQWDNRLKFEIYCYIMVFVVIGLLLNYLIGSSPLVRMVHTWVCMWDIRIFLWDRTILIRKWIRITMKVSSSLENTC